MKWGRIGGLLGCLGMGCLANAENVPTEVSLSTIPWMKVGESHVWRRSIAMYFWPWWESYVDQVRKQRDLQIEPGEEMGSQGWGNFYESWYREDFWYTSYMKKERSEGTYYDLYHNLLLELETWLDSQSMDVERKIRVREDFRKAWDVVSRARFFRERGTQSLSLDELGLDLPAPLWDLLKVLAVKRSAWGEQEVSRLRKLSVSADPAWKSMQGRAHFLLGLLWIESQPDQAIHEFEYLRDKVEKGLPDPEQCVVQSHGWEASIAYKERNHYEALAGYVESNVAGFNDTVSLRWTLDRIQELEADELKPYAEHPQFARILSMYGVAPVWGKKRTDRVIRFWQRWLPLVWESPYLDEEQDALLLGAWLLQDQERVLQRLRKIGVKSITGHLLRARLSLEEGEEEAALEHYGQALALGREELLREELGESEGIQLNLMVGDRWSVSGIFLERGMLHLKRNEFSEALLDVLTVSDSDAAMIAERILTVKELMDLLSEEQQIQERFEYLPERKVYCARMLPWIHRLLARRLAREGRWEEALLWFERSDDLLDNQENELIEASPAQQVREILAWQEVLKNPKLADEERAGILWEIGQMLYTHGLDLIGTESHPDFKIHNAMFAYPLYYRNDVFYWKSSFPLSVDAIARIESSAPTWNDRYHYRYVAADYGWQAAQFLPDNDERTARILWQSGRWLMYLNPQQADRFYKSLVMRNRNTPIGKEADRLRWFPATWPEAELPISL